MKIFKKLVLIGLAGVLALGLAACGDKSGDSSGFDDGIFEADSSETLAGTGATGGPISFTSRVAAFDRSAPSHVVVRVDLENGFDHVTVQNMTVPDEYVKYSNGKLAIHQDYFTNEFDTHFDAALTVYDDAGNYSNECRMVIADKIIYTADELMQINSSAEALSQYYVLGNDISFAGKTFTMIGCVTDSDRDSVDNPFRGLFEGAGHTISDVTIDKSGGGAEAANGFQVGLFKSVGSGGIVRNLAAKNITVRAGGGIGGGLVGVNGGTVTNCYVESTVTALDWNEPCGGMIGFNNAGVTVDGCVAVSNVQGLAFCGGNFGSITNSYALAKTGSALAELGGFLHAGVEADPYDEGFEVKNHFACDMFEGTTTNCTVYEGEENQGMLNTPSNLSNLDVKYWNLTSSGPVLWKMFLGNPSSAA